MKIFILISVICIINGYPSSNNLDDKCLNYCSNDGICVIIRNEPECYCLPEWEGKLCETPRDIQTIYIGESQQLRMSSARNHPCSLAPPNLCNGGLCQYESNTLSCACPFTRVGTRCERESPCNGFCMNGGICTYTEADESTTCNCTEQYKGTRCTLQITTTLDPNVTTTTTTTTTTTNAECAPFQSFCNGGTAILENAKCKCQCPQGKIGEYCETDTGATPAPGTINPGTINPGTINPGTGNPGTGNPGVTNPPSGDNACASNPCLNNRPCYNTGNTFYCFCGNSFTGSRCETQSG